jgi:choice-of-anchor C domain-containing protein
MLVGGFGNAFAAPNIVSNGSFETVDADCTGTFTSIPPSSATIQDWAVGGPYGIDWICNLWEAADGNKSIDMSGTNPADGPPYDGVPSDAGSVSQNLATIDGATYHVTFSMSGNPGAGPTIKDMTVSTQDDSEQFTYDITGNNYPTPMNWKEKTWDFVAPVGGTTTLTFTSDTDLPWGPALDNVSAVLSACPTGYDLVDDTCVRSNHNPVAGELVPLNTTALFISSLSSSMIWMAPTILGIAGVGVYIKSKKN